MLLRQPTPGRPDEGAVGGDDRPLTTRHPRLVPEQALQGQEAAEQNDGEADAEGDGKKYKELQLFDTNVCFNSSRNLN